MRSASPKEHAGGARRVRGRIRERDGRYYFVFRAQGTLRAIPVKRNADGTWKPAFSEFDRGVWSENSRNAKGGTDCIVHIPAFEVGGEVHMPTEEGQG